MEPQRQDRRGRKCQDTANRDKNRSQAAALGFSSQTEHGGATASRMPVHIHPPGRSLQHFLGAWGASLHDPQRLYSMSAVFLVYRFISVDSFLRLILESMSQFLPGGLAKYRTLSRGSFLLRIFKDTSALGLIAIVNIPGSKFTFGPLGCDLPHPRAPSLLLPWRL